MKMLNKISVVFEGYMTRILIGFLLVVFFNINLYARWATLQDSSIRTIESNTNISVNKDYTYESTVEFLDEILKEQGRQNYSKYTFGYDIKREKIEILDAYTIFEGKKYIVNEEEVENKPLASEANAIAEYGQISIAFPKVVVGAKIYLKYKIKVSNPSPPKYFSQYFSFGKGGYSENANVTINSAIPLYSYVNDPNKVLEIKEKIPNIFTIIIPRHPKRIEEIILTVKKHELSYVTDINNYKHHETELLLVSSFGVLGNYFEVADVVFIGGSLVNIGGHNIIEPAKQSCAIIVGPHTSNFKDIIDDFKSKKAIVVARDYDELMGELLKLFNDSNYKNQLIANSNNIITAQKNISKIAIDTIYHYIK